LNPQNAERARRLFFALWPDDATRQRITEVTAPQVRAAAGRTTPSRNLHVTLAFLGSVAESRVGCVTAAAAGIVSCTFDLRLVRVEHWRRQRILSFEPAETPPALDELVATLWQALRACDFEREARPFRAHLTLARDARPPRGVATDIEPIHWSVRELSLIESVTAPQGSLYTCLQSWPLARENPA
jgi:2'-5' RNA ligase